MDKDSLEGLRTALGGKLTEFFPKGIEGIIERETYQSETFTSAGYHHMPERYGLGDRVIYTIQHGDGTMTLVLTGKVSSGNPFEVGHATGGGVDLRKDFTVVYQYDGDETITETRLDTGHVNTFEGIYGRPDILLSYLRKNLGRRAE